MKRCLMLMGLLLLLLPGLAAAQGEPPHMSELYPKAYAALGEGNYTVPEYDADIYAQAKNAYYVLERQGKAFALDAQGGELFPAEYGSIMPIYIYSYATHQQEMTPYMGLGKRVDGDSSASGYQYALGNVQGEVLTPFLFSFIDFVQGDLVAGYREDADMYGPMLYNWKTQSIVVQATGDDYWSVFQVASFVGLYKENAGILEMYTPDGEVLSSEQGLESVYRGSDDFAVLVWQDGRIEILREEDGALVRGTSIEADYVDGVYNGIYIGAVKNGLMGMYATDGTELLPMLYANVFPASETVFIVRGDGNGGWKEYLIDNLGNRLGEASFDGIAIFEPGAARTLAWNEVTDRSLEYFWLGIDGSVEPIALPGFGDIEIRDMQLMPSDVGASTFTTINAAGEYQHRSGLRDESGSWIVPPGLYTYIVPLFSEGNPPIYYGEYASSLMGLGVEPEPQEEDALPEGEGYAYTGIGEIFDLNGYVRLRNVREVLSFDGRNFVLTRGFERGIMDMDGSWVQACPLFDELED